MAPRNATIDGMRALAASSVVLLHTSAMRIGSGAPGFVVRFINGVTPWGMPFFLPVAGYFHGRSQRALDDPVTWRWDRVRRIAAPYVFWSLAYMAFRVWLSLRAGGGLPRWNFASLLLAGDANSSLWFLPAVLYSGLLLSFFPSRRAAKVIASIALPAAVVITFVGAYVPYSPFYYRLPLALSAYCIGYLVGTRPPEIAPARRRLLAPLAVGLAVACGIGIALLPALAGNTALACAAGIVVTLGFWTVGVLAFLWALGADPEAWVAKVAPASSLALGVYASHTLAIMAVAQAIPPGSMDPVLWVGVAYVLVLTAAFGVSWLIARVPALRPLVS
jgi:surface polysaccharide O-acyltransferase-like enzyme